jgi:hypothetical protein
MHICTSSLVIRRKNSPRGGQIKTFETQIATPVRAHPDGAIFLSLFKHPDSFITAAELPAEIGECRARYPTRDALAADAGHAAVAIESGKRKTASFRWGCNQRLRPSFSRLADTPRHWHPRAADRYAAARARGHDHPHALRTLGRAQSSIVWQCWQDRTPYDPARPSAKRLTARLHPLPRSGDDAGRLLWAAGQLKQQSRRRRWSGDGTSGLARDQAAAGGVPIRQPARGLASASATGGRAAPRRALASGSVAARSAAVSTLTGVAIALRSDGRPAMRA